MIEKIKNTCKTQVYTCFLKNKFNYAKLITSSFNILIDL